MTNLSTSGKQPITGYILSKDGLKIAYTKFGNGAAVVIVHGSYSVQDHWFAFASLLAETNTVYVYDRRGRGQSPDSEKPFSFQSEVDDLAAIVDLAGQGVSIIAHSYGGAVGLSYLLQSAFRGPIVFYEPMNGIFDTVSQGLLPQLNSLVEEGKFGNSA